MANRRTTQPAIPVFECYVCGDQFSSPQGRAAHLRQRHEEHFKQYGIAPAPPPAPPQKAAPPEMVEVLGSDPVITKEFVAAMDISEVTEEPKLTPVEHLDAAIHGMQLELEGVISDISRLQGLEERKKFLTERVAELTRSRKGFEPAAPEGTKTAGAAS